MSLINDALRRARDAHPHPPPPPPIKAPLIPAEPAIVSRARSSVGWALGLGLTCVVTATVLGLWYAFAFKTRPTPVRAAAPAEPARARAHAPQPTVAAAPAVPEPALAVPVARPSQPLPGSPVIDSSGAEPGRATPIRPAGAEVTAGPEAKLDVTGADQIPPVGVSNAASGQVAAVPPPTPVFKLQGIIYHPARPSAVVNGRVVVTGSRLGAFRVAGIDREKVTLVGAGQTNVLSLSD